MPWEDIVGRIIVVVVIFVSAYVGFEYGWGGKKEKKEEKQEENEEEWGE